MTSISTKKHNNNIILNVIRSCGNFFTLYTKQISYTTELHVQNTYYYVIMYNIHSYDLYAKCECVQ